MNDVNLSRQGESVKDSAVRESDDGTYEEYQTRSSSEYTYYRDSDYASDEPPERVVNQSSCTARKSCSEIGGLSNFKSKSVDHS